MQYNPTKKRWLDIFLSSTALLFFQPLFYTVIIFIKLDSKGKPFFIQKRIGKNFVPFPLIKFRSMKTALTVKNSWFDPGESGRITRVGHFLRKTKIDELPELFNVLKGDMRVLLDRDQKLKNTLDII